MPKQREKLWLYDAVEPGQLGPSTVVTLTAEQISQYALIAQNADSRFQQPNAGEKAQGALVAMPTMVLSYAPLMREDIADANGFVALERSSTARRQTPFAKCEIRWSGPVIAGDTITATRRVLEKYERRGSKFVTFRVEATNQQGQEVVQYDYTCIFDYAQGRKSVPQEPGVAQPAPINGGTQNPPSATFLTFDSLSFDSLSIGDQLATLAVSESQEIINRKDSFRLAGTPNPINIHTDEEFARQNIFSGTVSSGPAAMSYLDQMLQRSFSLSAFYQGGQLLMRAIEPFRAGDTVTFQGEVTAKREYPPSVPPNQGGRKGGVVECRVKAINQRGDLVNLSDARLILPD